MKSESHSWKNITHHAGACWVNSNHTTITHRHSLRIAKIQRMANRMNDLDYCWFSGMLPRAARRVSAPRQKKIEWHRKRKAFFRLRIWQWWGWECDEVYVVGSSPWQLPRSERRTATAKYTICSRNYYLFWKCAYVKAGVLLQNKLHVLIDGRLKS